MADNSYTPGIYVEQGATRQVVKSGASIDVESGGEIDIESGGSLKIAGTAVTSTAAELNKVDGIAVGFTLAAAAGGSNVCEVTITAVNAAGTTVAAAHMLDVFMSDAATGAGLTGTSASGTVTVKAASGAVIDTYVSKKALKVQSLATGIFTLEITDTGKTGFYVCASAPLGGAAVVSTQLVTGDYG